MLTIKATDQAANKAKRFSTLGKAHIYIEAPKVPRSLPIDGVELKDEEEVPIHFPLGLQEFDVKSNWKKGTTIGKVDILNPKNVELHWVMRHRYRNGGNSSFSFIWELTYSLWVIVEQAVTNFVVQNAIIK